MTIKEQLYIIAGALLSGACCAIVGAIIGGMGQIDAQIYIDAPHIATGAALGFLCGFIAPIIERLTRRDND